MRVLFSFVAFRFLFCFVFTVYFLPNVVLFQSPRESYKAKLDHHLKMKGLVFREAIAAFRVDINLKLGKCLSDELHCVPSFN